MNLVYLLTGANLNEPLKQLHKAVQHIEKKIGEIEIASSIFESEAWGVEDQPVFLNQVLAIKSELDANKILEIILEIETVLGRERKEKWGSRVIDIDILYFNQEVIDTKDLQIPHPYIQKRNFTLIPLVEISPNYIHPILNKSNAQLLKESVDPLQVRPLT